MTPHLPTRTLRERPDLDQLKRQAKELLHGFINGDADRHIPTAVTPLHMEGLSLGL